jgi:hypothetical protein
VDCRGSGYCSEVGSVLAVIDSVIIGRFLDHVRDIDFSQDEDFQQQY